MNMIDWEWILRLPLAGMWVAAALEGFQIESFN